MATLISYCAGVLTNVQSSGKAPFTYTINCSVPWQSDNYVVGSTVSLQDIFNIPIASDLLQMWELGFGLPILCYLVAWAYGTVINFFNDRHS